MKKMEFNLQLAFYQTKCYRRNDEANMPCFTCQMPFLNDIYMHLLKCKLPLHKYCDL